MADGRDGDVLALVRALFESLEANAVEYVHWKSNEHLGPALKGDTDLDLLVKEGQRNRFEEVLRGLGFVPLEAAAARHIPGSVSHLGFDEATGKLVHLDVQYRLAVGEQLLKNHRLPVEEWLMAGSGRLEGVHIPQAERELAVLYVRTMLKTTNRQLIRARLKGGSPVPDRISKEALWLVPQTEADALGSAVAAADLDLTAEEVIEFRDRVERGRLDRTYVAERRNSLRRRLARFKRMPAYRAVPKKLLLRLRSRPWAGSLGIAIPKRRFAGKGLFVAAVGADGSGKSRLTRDIEKWLGAKTQVRHLYFGQPKGGFVFKLLNKPGSMSRKRDDGGVLGSLARYTDAMKWVTLARRRGSMSTGARRAADDGVVVIAERFPLPEFFAMDTPMDGPRLQPGGPLARTELRQYRDIGQPDLVLVLDTSLETLRDRKLDLTVEEHRAKVAAVQSLSPERGRLIIDAGRPYEEVLLTAQSAIWEAIREGR